MKISRIRDVKIPTRGTSKSAGIDLYIPKFTDTFLKDLTEKNNYLKDRILNNKIIKLNPHERILIPSGIKINIPENCMLQANNKSGISTKKGLDVLAAIIDEDYCGEIHISIVNTSEKFIYIEEEEKIIQLILIPILYCSIEEVSIEKLYDKITERGDGGFGSTGN